MKGALDIAPKRSGVFHATGRYHMENGELEKAGLAAPADGNTTR